MLIELAVRVAHGGPVCDGCHRSATDWYATLTWGGRSGQTVKYALCPACAAELNVDRVVLWRLLDPAEPSEPTTAHRS